MTLYTYPDKVRPSSKIYRFIDYNKIGYGVYWNHQTFGDRQQAARCRWNTGCWDVSKRRIQELFDTISTYRLSVDSSTFNGLCVEKSNRQYAHDGKIVKCPTEPRPGKVYQRFIDSSVSDTHFSEFRVFYHWGIDFVIEKIKPKTDQWRWKADCLQAHEKNVFSDSNQLLIERFCNKFGLDFGELDVLQQDERIYIIDVNNIAGNGSYVLDEFPQLKRRYTKAVHALCVLDC